jgi:hypothetical protein
MGDEDGSADVAVELSEDERAVSYVTGRNGTFTPRAVAIWMGHGPAHIDAIGRRGPIRGGITLPATKMDELAMKWLQARGIVMPAR